MARRDPAPVLLVEDDENDVTFLRLALEQAGLPNRLVPFSTAEAAIKYLQGAPPYEDRKVHPLPALLLLDLQIQNSTAYKVLAYLHSRPELRHLPAVVLSGSADEAAGEEVRRRGAVEFQIKPNRFADLVGLVQGWQTRWLGASQAPPARSSPAS